MELANNLMIEIEFFLSFMSGFSLPCLQELEKLGEGNQIIKESIHLLSIVSGYLVISFQQRVMRLF